VRCKSTGVQRKMIRRLRNDELEKSCADLIGGISRNIRGSTEEGYKKQPASLPKSDLKTS
jgi:hypothetical protein